MSPPAEEPLRGTSLQRKCGFFGKICSMTFKNDFGQGQGRRAQTSSGTGRRGGGGGLPIAVGGGGVGTIILLAIVFFLNGGLGGLGGGSGSQPAPQGQPQGQGGYDLTHCDAPGAANEHADCRAEAVARSVDQVWSEVLPSQANIEYEPAGITLFRGDVSTGCGYATADTGPFYCPRDTTAYLDASFFEQLEQLGGSAGALSQEYVTAHEMGHHIQQLEGTLGLSDYQNPGEDSAAVAIELQADCYAGIWAKHASEGPDAALEPITDDQLNQAIQTAQAIGDDNIQRKSGGDIDPDAWTHGSSEQRSEAFKSGYDTGQMAACDTLNRGVYAES